MSATNRSRRASDLLTAHIAQIGTYGDERWLFQPGKRIAQPQHAVHQWRSFAKRWAWKASPFTILRSFYASGLIATGYDVVTVQRALGHASARPGGRLRMRARAVAAAC